VSEDQEPLPEYSPPKELQEVGESQPKQYLLLVDSLNMLLLGKMMPGLGFVEVQGMKIKEKETHYVMISPIPINEPA
jgi:hypothetical protein